MIDNNNDHTRWDSVVRDLRNQSGLAVLDLPEDTASIPATAFALARSFFQQQPHDTVHTLSPDTPSAHATGYHPAGGCLSRKYNLFRQGLIYSDDTHTIPGLPPALEKALALLRHTMHDLGEQVVAALEKDLELEVSWMANHLGPSMRQHSQWHLKQYEPSSSTTDSLWLPVHTDPSLISIVILDAPGVQDGAQGLEYMHEGRWIEVPQSGHAVAIVLVGSIGAMLTGLPACQHRVVAGGKSDRRAATLFVRPAPTALLERPPSRKLEHLPPLRRRQTFEEWNNRVSKNYRTSKKT